MSETLPQPTANQAFKTDVLEHPEYGQGQAEWEAYLASRPAKDAEGTVHAPDGTSFDGAYAEDYFTEEYRAADQKQNDQTPYEEMLPSQLARKLAHAEFHGDETSQQNINNVLDRKLDELDYEYSSERDNGSTSSTRRHPDNGRNHNDLRSEKLEDRVLKIRDRELEKLGAERQSQESQESETGGGEPADGQPEASTTDGHTASADNSLAGATGPVTPTTEQLPVQPAASATPTTEQLPITPGAERAPESAEPGSQPESKPQTRWDRLKRGIRKHMYETPVDMSPMGPTIQPEIPFDEWYAQKQQGKGPSRVGQAIDNAIDATGEKLGDLTDFVDYIGNIALIDTAYHAGNAADAARHHAGNAADTARYHASNAAASARYHAGNASDTAIYHAGNAAAFARERVEDAAELAGRATQRATYLGYITLGRMAELPAQLKERLLSSRRLKKSGPAVAEGSEEGPVDWSPEELEPANWVKLRAVRNKWDWDENWDWIE